MKYSLLIRALDALRLNIASLLEWKNLDAALCSLVLMALLRFTVYHSLRHEIFEMSGARLSMCGAVNKSVCYFFIVCAGFVVFQILRGRLL